MSVVTSLYRILRFTTLNSQISARGISNIRIVSALVLCISLFVVIGVTTDCRQPFAR